MREATLPIGLKRRREDYQLITGRARFVDDVRLPQERPTILHMTFVRSPYAHAKITRVKFNAARDVPGVVALLTGADLVNNLRPLNIAIPLPGLKKPDRMPLALEKVRYVGDPIAIILAESLSIAEDAKNLVEVDYDPLASVVDPEVALVPGVPLLYEDFGSNVAFQTRSGQGDLQATFAQTDHTITLRLVNQRLAPSSLEPRACLFDYDPTVGKLTGWVSSQGVYRMREALSSMLGIERDFIHVMNAEVGGGFGSKNGYVGEEFVAAWLAVKYGRPVKWIETRSENLQSQTQGRGQINYVEAAFQNDGRLLGLNVHTVADLGAFLTPMTAMIPNSTSSFLNGPYRLEAVASQVIGVFTNKVPTAPYRGMGRPEATYLLERTIDRIASELGLDPAEVRSRNFIPSSAFPYKTLTNVTYDSGNYQMALDRALALAEYERWRAKQRERRASHLTSLLGIGISTFIESTGFSLGPRRPGVLYESATVRILRDGTLLVQSGVAANGQGYFTAFAQIVASLFHLPDSEVEVHMNDSDLPAFGYGTFASRTLQTAGTAVLLAAEAVREKALRVAAQLLQADPTDMRIEHGYMMSQSDPDRSIALGELARLVEEQPWLVEHEPPNPANGKSIEGLAAWRDFSPPGATFASGAHVAVVEVDTETGEVQILSYVAVDDCGRILNPYLVDAQVQGGLAQGIGQALYEEVKYDEASGQLLTGTLMDYALPSAEQVPAFVTDTIETPSPYNPLGAKGVGEAGCIAAPPAIVNAVLDALAPLGITGIDMPLTPQKVWTLVQSARDGRLVQPHFTLPPVFISRET